MSVYVEILKYKKYKYPAYVNKIINVCQLVRTLLR